MSPSASKYHPILGRLQFLASAGIVLFFGCHTVTVSMEILRPAPITLPMEIKKVAVVDLTAFAQETFIYSYENDRPSTRFRELRTVSAELACKALANELQRLGRLNLQIIIIPMDTSLRLETARWKYLQKLGTDSGYQAFICLENLEGRIQSNSYIGLATQLDPFGYPYQVPAFSGSRHIEVRQTWRIRSYPENVELDYYVAEKKLSFLRDGFSADQVYNSLPDRKGSFENAAQACAVEYARRLIPYWQKVERKIYTGYSIPWLNAADSALVGNWKDAVAQWEKLFKKAAFRFQKKQLYHNICVGYEMQEDFDNALRYAQNGYRQFRAGSFKRLEALLLQRIDEAALLDKQIGPVRQ
ncbi:MAG: DUF6340 family protein [Flavobacteriales bacterium]|nr:DUF6340 family protein [Flavobacteriales bacterium]